MTSSIAKIPRINGEMCDIMVISWRCLLTVMMMTMMTMVTMIMMSKDHDDDDDDVGNS